MSKYKVLVERTTIVIVEVDAETKDQAREAGLMRGLEEHLGWDHEDSMFTSCLEEEYEG